MEFMTFCGKNSSYKKDEYMWEAYANHKNGICIVFNVDNYDMLYPVEYFNKDDIDYTSILINDYFRTQQELCKNGSPMAELPFVIKNPMNGDMKSYEEKEVRILMEPYGDSSFNNGFVKPQIKEDEGYKGQNISYANCELSVSRVIIGENCNKKIANDIITNCNKKGYIVEKVAD